MISPDCCGAPQRRTGRLHRSYRWLVHQTVRHSAWLAAHPWILGSAVLAGAGLYQLSPLKRRCLAECRLLVGFILGRWHGRSERLRALRLGLDHGCCWPLMLLMFALGLGNVAVMLLIGAVIAVEKNLPWGGGIRNPLACRSLPGGCDRTRDGVDVVVMAGQRNRQD
jgi:predicted metal-binding membrane protein